MRLGCQFLLKKLWLVGAIILLRILVNPLPVLCQGYPYKFKYLTVDEGLSHTDANHISQDQKGYLWIATNFGLDRYDGYTVKKYYNNNTPIHNAQKNRILCSYPDQNGRIWLGTEDGLQCFDPSIEKYRDFYSNEKSNLVFAKLIKPAGDLIYGLADGQPKIYLIKGNVLTRLPLVIPAGVSFSDLQTDHNGNAYLAGSSGLWSLNHNGKLSKVKLSGFPGGAVRNLCFNDKNELAFASDGELFLTKGAAATSPPAALAVTKHFTGAANEPIDKIAVDKRGNYWLNTGSSVIKLDNSLRFVQKIAERSLAYGLNSSVLLNIFIDRSQCLWICTAGGGVNYCDLNQKQFYTLQHDPGDPNSLSGNHIRSVLEDGNNLWIGTNANGLSRYDFNTRTFTAFNSHSSPIRLKSDIISALMLDKDQNLWIGSQAGIDILRPGRKQLWQPDGFHQFPGYGIESLAQDCFGNIWFGNHYKLGVLWQDKPGHYRVKEYDEGYFILTDKTKPVIFVSSRHGLKQLTVDKNGNIIRTVQYTASTDSNSLSSNYISPLSRQNDSTYWIGTIGGGLNRLTFSSNGRYSIKRFGNKYGVFNDVEAVEIDRAGQLWLGGNALLRFDPVTGGTIRYEKSDGLQGNSFKVRASYKGASGRLYFGGINGLNYFYPEQISFNTIGARPVITDILINNQQPNYEHSDSAKNYIGKAVGYNRELKLSYLQNNFVLFFSAMHFANPLKCSYRYKLLGFDTDWRYTDGKNPSAAYSNLDFKAYRFIVEASNNDGLWSKAVAETGITIIPPWWKSAPAKVIYVLLFISMLAAIYIYQARLYRFKREIELRAINEKKREEMHLQREEMHRQREELYQQQLIFFTNISHEFRTPLTLILGPLENLIRQNKNTTLDSSYQLMLRNAKRLMNLISELMNFKKVADSLIKLQVSPLVLDQFCENLAQEFQNLAYDKQITFEMTVNVPAGPSSTLNGPFDAHILEKILFNLLSNAFKYTPAGGRVSFELLTDIGVIKPAYQTTFRLLNEQFRAERYIYFRIVDSGIGISADSISRIFDRYYRISKDHLGSGVGLALVKSLTLLHKGDIYVYSEKQLGTEIIIGIPWGDENYSDAEKATDPSVPDTKLEMIDHSILAPLDKKIDQAVKITPKSDKRLLIVDDNQELRIFLRQTLQPYYQVIEAEDGCAAMELMAGTLPDLIISDVMMPVMDGIEFCRLIKAQPETKHIPFIILSAKDTLSSKIHGLESGADLYFGKPINIDLLLLTINNLFDQEENLKLRYTNDYLLNATKNLSTEKDKEFATKLLTAIERNLHRTDLDVDFLCKQLFVSRTKLYQQIKKIADQPVGDFIRTVRLKKAIYIMTHENVTMNEVAEKIGLQSSSNFSRTFKKEYGKSPLRFIQALKNEAIKN